MTDQSKPTTDMPDVIYASRDDYHYPTWNSTYFIKSQVKYIRADLVPAAPTGDKAAPLELFDRCYGGSTSGVFGKTSTYVFLPEEKDEIRAALQENTAPDDLLNVLEELLQSGSAFYPSAIEANVADNPRDFDCEEWQQRAIEVVVKYRSESLSKLMKECEK